MSDEIDFEELAAWVLTMTARKHGFTVTDKGDIERVRAAVIAAVNGDSGEVRVALSIDGPNGPIAIDEHMTRTAARNLFAPAPTKATNDARDRDREAAALPQTSSASKKPSGSREIYDMFFGFPYIGQFVIAVLAVVGLVTFFVERHDGHHEHQDTVKRAPDEHR